ncbi:amidohydrolase [Bacillus sp. NPDC077027]|uniref:amidohydrolase n=1 Tax=Bacillus sp. NPDC077027 TaxID=3390548 RepID=UPI003D04BA7C
MKTTHNEALNKRLINMRRELHENPELSFEEYETTKKLRYWLEEAGITIAHYPALKTGIVCEIKGKQEGPIIAIRADIDALPIQEASGVSFSSKVKGKMHACGHDFHTASIFGTAVLLNDRKEDLKGTVRIIFQPAEEIAQGAKHVIEAGALDGVSAIFGMHNKPDLPVGTIGVREDALMASVDRFEIEIIGKGGHAGIPNHSIDPIAISGQITSALQQIVSRHISSLHHAVVSLTRIQGGTSWNVIPDRVEMEGTVRTFEPEVRAAIPDLMKRITIGIAESFGAQAEVRWHPYLPSVINDKRLTKVVEQTARQVGLIVTNAAQSPGGEDFALYQEKIPGFFVWMGTSGTEEWHHPAFTLNEDALGIAAAYFAELAVNALESQTWS